MEILEKSRFAVTIASGASNQGVATDGTYIYQTDSYTLRKYNTAGVLQSTKITSTDGSVTNNGDLCIGHNGNIFIACHNNNVGSPLAYVKEYTTSLVYVGEYLVSNTDLFASISLHDNKYYMTARSSIIHEFDTSFTLLNSYATDYVFSNSIYGWQGSTWVDDEIILSPHEGVVPCTIQRYSFDGTSFKLVECLDKPYECTQGIEYDSTNKELLMALRSTGGDIVTTQIVPYDGRKSVVVSVFDGTERSITNTSYVQQANLIASIYVKKDDIVEARIDGLFGVTASALRAKLEVVSGSAVDADLLTTYPTMRTDETSAEKASLGQTRWFHCLEDGRLGIVMQWKINGSGTAKCIDRAITLKVVGRMTS